MIQIYSFLFKIVKGFMEKVTAGETLTSVPPSVAWYANT